MSAVLVGNGRFLLDPYNFCSVGCELFCFLLLGQVNFRSYVHCLGIRRRRGYNRPSRQPVSSTVWNLQNRQPEEGGGPST